MIIHRDYDQEKRLDRVWYNSSNVFYSECEDVVDDYKILRVVFNNGATYEYKNVDVNDYVMFVRGGLDGSNGRALNKYIKPKCECERIEDLGKEKLTEELNRLLEEKKQKKLLEEQEKQETNESDEKENGED
jgi:hypothetical protein